MSKTIAIVQSNYIPWKGYFDLIGLVDEFILFDDMQYTRRDWRNRNRIKTPQGVQWLVIPVRSKGNYHAPICEIEVSDPFWAVRHWKTIRFNYGRAPYFHQFESFFEELYLECEERYLSRINYRFLKAICDLLDIRTKLSWSMDYTLIEGRTERIVDLCYQAGATRYLTGPSARSYLNEQLFDEAGIELVYMDYSGYPEYPQLYPPFEHAVSVIDLIFNTGPKARKYMKSMG
ncbi:hypothetical protein D6779_00440 [Candidatus Parcubacteria bacterium]|nr:MAG: hypothetical protein D6779_00440 [Candidatus Parcubacteria bacterium]